MKNFLEADLLLINAVFPLRKKSDEENALLIKNGKIEGIGPTSLLKNFPSKKVIDLEDRAVYPGFVAAHDHFMMFCQTSSILECKTRPGEPINDYLHRLSLLLPKVEKGEWIRFSGLADFKLAEGRFPTREELDALAPDNPVTLLHASLHSVVMNSEALKRIGIKLTRLGTGENSSEIMRDEKGNATGTLHETAAMPHVFSPCIESFLKLSEDEQIDAISKGSADFGSFGYTAVHDPLVSPENFRLYQKAAARGVLRQRMVLSPDFTSCAGLLESGILSGFGNSALKIGPVKIIADGAIGGKTAAISKPYLGTDSCGILYESQEKMDETVSLLNSKDYGIAIHAIGDRALEQVLSAYEKVIRPKVGNVKRFRIEHGSVQTPALIKKIAELAIPVTIQPQALRELGDGVLNSFGDRIEMFCPYRSLMDAGVVVASSADAPIFNISPLKGMAAAYFRNTEEGFVMAPQESLSPLQALKTYTINGAYALGIEDRTGKIEEGMDADLVVLSHDLLRADPAEWETVVTVEMTLKEGKIIYRNENQTDRRPIY